MQPFRRFSPASQTVLALVLGGWVGACLYEAHSYSRLAWLAEQACHGMALACLAWVRALAVPLVIVTLVLGGVGLEPMRGMGHLMRRTLRWIVGSSVLAVVIAFGSLWVVVRCVDLESIFSFPSYYNVPLLSEGGVWTWGWLALVLVGLTFGYYRNQIEEGQGRLITRFCQALEGMLGPALRHTETYGALGIFFITASGVAKFHDRGLPEVPLVAAGADWMFYTRALLILGGVIILYVLVFSWWVWWKTRANVWRCVPALFPSMGLAAMGWSLEAALPLTLDVMRRKAGVSNRVAGTTLSLGAVLGRDGWALMWTSLMLGTPLYTQSPVAWDDLVYVALAGWVIGSGVGALSTGSGLFSLFLFGGVPRHDAIPPAVLGAIAMSIGCAVSVFSQACATIVIARSEGEYWVPGPPPDADELQGLKSDLATGEG